MGLVDGLLGCLTLTARSTSLSACLARFGGWDTLFQGDYNKFFQRGPLGSTILRKSSFGKAQTPAPNPTARRGHFWGRFLAVFLKENTPPNFFSALRGQLSRRGACGAAARRRLL